MVRAGTRCLEKVRRRVENETLDHRRRKHGPLYRIRSCSSQRLERPATSASCWACGRAHTVEGFSLPGIPCLLGSPDMHGPSLGNLE